MSRRSRFSDDFKAKVAVEELQRVQYSLSASIIASRLCRATSSESVFSPIRIVPRRAKCATSEGTRRVYCHRPRLL